MLYTFTNEHIFLGGNYIIIYMKTIGDQLYLTRYNLYTIYLVPFSREAFFVLFIIGQYVVILYMIVYIV